MKSISIRDLRQRWPEAEAALQLEKEILITRDSKPVAKLVRVLEKPTRRQVWDAKTHRRTVARILRNRIFSTIDERLGKARADRNS